MKKRGCLSIIGGFTLFIIVICLIAGSSSKDKDVEVATDNKEVKQEEQVKEQPKEEVKEETKEEAPQTYEFSSGNYVCGEDFNPGKYDILVTQGSGNVYCLENMLNMMAGSEEAIKEAESIGMKDIYQKEFKNSKFKKGNTLTIKDCTIQLIGK